MSIVPTSVSNVFASPDALSLVEKFCSCPAALKLFSSAVKPLFIISTTQASASFAPAKGHAWIQIPKRELQTKDSLDSLAFEMFNAQNSLGDLIRRGIRSDDGKVGMDTYAIETQMEEHFRTRGIAQLKEQCAEVWDLAPDTRFQDPILDLFEQEVNCHTDSYRQQWIDNHQTNYCAKHPEDKRSCEVNKEDLCDYLKVLELPEHDRSKLEKERFCKMFPHAHEKVKEYHRWRAAIQCNNDIMIALTSVLGAVIGFHINAIRAIYRRVVG